MNRTRVTMGDLARALNLHHSTVSRALKNDRRISQKTREQVLRAAKEMGYRPDPMLSSLIEYRLQHSKKNYQAHLGWITHYPTKDGWREFEKTAYFRGATRRAAELGYKLEDIWLGEPGMTQQRATKMLRARNIAGVFFIAPPRARAHLSMDWSKFSAVVFGRILVQPVFHNVDNDHFRSFVLLMRQLKRLGYRRPGFACWQRVHERIERTWKAAFAEYQPLPKQEIIPVFMHQPWTEPEFKKWFDRHRPDVVVTNDETLLAWMEGWGLKVPEDVGFALAAKHGEASSRCSGMDENSEFVGESAVNVLVGMIQRGESGIPAIPVSTLIQGRWINGTTLRRVNRA